MGNIFLIILNKTKLLLLQLLIPTLFQDKLLDKGLLTKVTVIILNDM